VANSLLQGTGAPQDSHLDYFKNLNASRVNLNQRTLYESKDIAENTKEYMLLKEIMEDAMKFIKVNVCLSSICSL